MGWSGCLFSSPVAKSATNAHFEFGIELMLLVERADDAVSGFRTSIALVDLDVAGGDVAFFVHGEAELSRFVICGFELHLFQVQNDVGDILDDARQRWQIRAARRRF